MTVQHALGVVAVMTLASAAPATFHAMQIEQVIGGVNGDTTLQAIQLRMRFAEQDLVSLARIRVWDATGANPIVVMDPETDVPVTAAGSRILICSAGFADLLDPPVTPDFIMENLIPASYLAAGSLTWEVDSGAQIYWRLCWGGAGYTGPTTLLTFNDADGNVAPPFSGVLQSADLRAVQFQGVASAMSTNSDADYELTAGASVWTNNAGAAGTLTAPKRPCVGDTDGSGDIGFPDLLAVLSNWGDYEPCPPHMPADFDQDCTVGFSDLLVVLSGWGPCR
jgi:hypothetical protein